MPVKIRLARMGRSKIAQYRIVAADSRMKRDGRFLETVGFYDPQTNPKTFKYKHDRVAFWLKNGALPTLTVKNLLRQDQFFVTAEGVAKGLTPEQMNVQRKPERRRKPKPKKEKK
ncbi:MAG: 30S ribosomal protein S16 [Chitinispirillaceae bacterium]|nr:30S ribosomal protein S16 [Chitinispirillaceae bacterium]